MDAFQGSHDPLNIPTAPSTGRSNNFASVFPEPVSLHLLEEITNGFSKDQKLGVGAYGTVYKGVHKNGETIAVKLLHCMPGCDEENFEKEFRNLSILQHKNIVRLVGFCHETRKEFVPNDKGKMIFAERTKMALCFEYMPNGDLSEYLFDEDSGPDWPIRYAIIKGICEGLKYLHEDLIEPILHLDLKPANILLDDKMMPKLADFGLSRIFGQEQTRITTSTIGTLGYLPPEYINDGIVSNKLDIFSLGVIIIKIIAGRTGYTQRDYSEKFIERVHKKWEHRLQETSADALEAYSEQVMRCIEMALSCVRENRYERPSMGEIIDTLNKMETKGQGSSTDQLLQVVSEDTCSTAAQESLVHAASYTTQEITNTKGVSRLREHVQYVMGDLVIGLTKSVVEGALSKVHWTIEEDARLPPGVQRDLVFIAGEFEMMQSFLRVTDEERVKNVVVRTWVRQMRKLAYDLENCMEFIVHLDTNTTSWWSRLFPMTCSPFLPLDMAVAEIEQLKARMEDVSTRNTRHSLISDPGSKPVVLQQQPGPRSAVLVDLTQLIAKKDDADLKVISVWGADGGAGTTSIIRKSYSDPGISHSFTCRAWVNLTHPFNPHEFVRSLMAHFYANSCQERRGAIIGVDVLTSMGESTTTTQGDFFGEFIQLVDKNRYLVVLENLSTMAEWDSVRTFLPDRKNGSRIIVSSRQYEIASSCVGHPYQVLDLKQLPAEHSICAFLREGSQDAGNKSVANSDSTWDSNKEKSTEYDLSYKERNNSFSYEYDHKIANPKKKAASDWMQNSPLVGLRLQINQLRRYIVQAQMNHCQVVSVWGIAGVGKSALVRNLYCNRILENQQFQEYGWVGLSHSQPFNLRDFSQSLLLDFQSESLQTKETAPFRSVVGIKDAVQKCCQLLNTRRCLVVIDGLQSIQDWNLIQSSLVSRYSKSETVILVITTEASVAAYCADNEDLVFHVKTLEADAAFDLFKNEVSKKTPIPVSLFCRGNEVLPELISKCGGLPLIILAMAGILASKGGAWMETASSINLRFMRELEINPEFESLWDLFSWMHSCFGSCPDSVKPCIFDLSLFPRDHNIRRRRLVRRWVADGYSQDGDDKSAEENGEEFFSKLHNLSIIQQAPQSATSSDVRMVLCRVNGFLRECILSQGIEENLVVELAGTCSLTNQRTGRHLVISDSWDRDRIVLERMDLSRLRSITVFGKWKSFFISQRTKLLQVLDLEDALGVTDNDVQQMVKLLPRLKFLSLRGCHGVFQLPSSLGNLWQLQTLDVRNTSIISLPSSITKLYKLQYIRGGTTTTAAQDPSAPHAFSWLSKFWRRRRPLVGVEVPSGIVKLMALHTLGVVNISGSGGEAILEEQNSELFSSALRKLGVFGVNRKNREAFFSAISSHANLGSLSVWLDEESRDCLGDISLPLENLQSLKLYGPLDRLPVLHVNQLSKLTKLHLEMTTLMDEAMELLGKLPKLCILRLCVNQPEDGRLHFHVFTDGLEEPSYQKVKVLDIAYRSILNVTFGSEAMKKLELLTLYCHSGSSYQFSGLDHLSELKEVWLKGSYEEAMKQQLQCQLADHPEEPVLKEIPRSST